MWLLTVDSIGCPLDNFSIILGCGLVAPGWIDNQNFEHCPPSNKQRCQFSDFNLKSDFFMPRLGHFHWFSACFRPFCPNLRTFSDFFFFQNWVASLNKLPLNFIPCGMPYWNYSEVSPCKTQVSSQQRFSSIVEQIKTSCTSGKWTFRTLSPWQKPMFFLFSFDLSDLIPLTKTHLFLFFFFSLLTDSGVHCIRPSHPLATGLVHPVVDMCKQDIKHASQVCTKSGCYILRWHSFPLLYLFFKLQEILKKLQQIGQNLDKDEL